MLEAIPRKFLDARIAVDDELAEHARAGFGAAFAVKVLQRDLFVAELEHKPAPLPIATDLTLLEQPTRLENVRITL